MNTKKKVFVPHGVIFIYDESCDVVIPFDTSAAPFLNTKNCVSVWTIDEYDGSAELSLISNFNNVHNLQYYEAEIEVCSNELSVFLSTCKKILSKKVTQKKVSVKVYHNGRYADKLYILINDVF